MTCAATWLTTLGLSAALWCVFWKQAVAHYNTLTLNTCVPFFLSLQIIRCCVLSNGDMLWPAKHESIRVLLNTVTGLQHLSENYTTIHTYDQHISILYLLSVACWLTNNNNISQKYEFLITQYLINISFFLKLWWTFAVNLVTYSFHRQINQYQPLQVKRSFVIILNK